MHEAQEKEPEVLFVGDSLIQQLAQREVRNFSSLALDPLDPDFSSIMAIKVLLLTAVRVHWLCI